MLYLGVDLGGTNIKAALVSENGEIVREAATPTNLPRTAQEVCDDIAALCLQLGAGEPVAGIGVGCPGTVCDGVVLYSNNLDWHDFAMADYLQAKIGLPVCLGNDANVAALGEALASCAKGGAERGDSDARHRRWCGHCAGRKAADRLHRRSGRTRPHGDSGHTRCPSVHLRAARLL